MTARTDGGERLREFLIPNHVELRDHASGWPLLHLAHASGASVEVFPYGAHVVSWRTADGRERLLLSRKAVYEPGKAIRGGIPVIFPQFGPGPIVTHGFARNREWHVVASSVTAHGEVSLTLALESDQATRAIWPHEFSLQLEIRLGERFTILLRTTNRGAASFEFQSALHTYFHVEDIARIKIPALAGHDYLDVTRSRERTKQPNLPVQIEGEVDRVYLGVPRKVTIVDSAPGERIAIETRDFLDATVWNPGPEKAAKLSDLDPNEYKQFVCVEAANVAAPIHLGPGSTHLAEQTVTIERD